MQTWLKTIPVALLVTLAGCGGPSAPSSIEVAEAWSPETPPGASVAAGYMTIRNGTAADDAIIAMESPVAGAVEAHTMTMEEGMMRMRKIENLEVPAGKSVVLEPGAMHLMLIDLKDPLAAGGRYPLTLTFKVAGKVQTEMEIRGSGGAKDDHSDHQH
jgi:copper(I)-binding protein